MLQAEIETRLTLRQFDILQQSYIRLEEAIFQQVSELIEILVVYYGVFEFPFY